jgi:hypothetical protein
MPNLCKINKNNFKNNLEFKFKGVHLNTETNQAV